MEKIILDTDIGTDVDDLIALALILKSPELDLLGVTTVYGDTRLRGKIVHKVLSLVGRGEIPVCPGKGETLLHNREIWMAGHEGSNGGIDRIPDSCLDRRFGPDFIIDTVRAHPDTINLIAIGPLTNVALAIIKAPEVMKKLKSLYIMGGVFAHFNLPLIEHNIKCDPEAARVVLESDIPINLVPLDVTESVPLTAADISKVGAAGTELHQFLHSELKTWLEYLQTEATNMHDPLTVAALLRPDLIEWQNRSVRVELKGEHTTGMTLAMEEGGNVSIATEVDAESFHDFLMSRLLQQ